MAENRSVPWRIGATKLEETRFERVFLWVGEMTKAKKNEFREYLQSREKELSAKVKAAVLQKASAETAIAAFSGALRECRTTISRFDSKD